eukprot:Pgem_evm1s5862
MKFSLYSLAFVVAITTQHVIVSNASPFNNIQVLHTDNINDFDNNNNNDDDDNLMDIFEYSADGTMIKYTVDEDQFLHERVRRGRTGERKRVKPTTMLGGIAVALGSLGQPGSSMPPLQKDTYHAVNQYNIDTMDMDAYVTNPISSTDYFRDGGSDLSLEELEYIYGKENAAQLFPNGGIMKEEISKYKNENVRKRVKESAMAQAPVSGVGWIRTNT